MSHILGADYLLLACAPNGEAVAKVARGMGHDGNEFALYGSFFLARA